MSSLIEWLGYRWQAVAEAVLVRVGVFRPVLCLTLKRVLLNCCIAEGAVSDHATYDHVIELRSVPPSMKIGDVEDLVASQSRTVKILDVKRYDDTTFVVALTSGDESHTDAHVIGLGVVCVLRGYVCVQLRERKRC